MPCIKFAQFIFTLMRNQLYICSVIFLLAACGSKEKTIKKESGPTEVEIIIAAAQKISDTLEVNGSVVANEQTELRPEVSGVLTYLNIPEGKNVSAGTILARVNSVDLQAQLKKQQSQLLLAQKNVERLSKLLEIQGINLADYDIAVNAVTTLQADIAVTKAQLQKTIVRAPFSGTIGLKQVSPGAYVTPQTVLASLQQLTKTKIDFNIPEAYSNAVAVGKHVNITVNNQNATATIIALEPELNTATRNLVARATVNGINVNPGTFVKVLLQTGDQKNNIVVPTSAVIPDAKTKQVILVKNGKGTFVNIETGLRMKGGVEVLKGLNAGDSVVVTGVLFVRNNAPVKVRSIRKLNEIIEE